MADLQLPEDLGTMPIIMVKKGSPAWDALRRICSSTGGPKPGMIIPISDEELKSLRDDTLAVNVR